MADLPRAFQNVIGLFKVVPLTPETSKKTPKLKCASFCGGSTEKTNSTWLKERSKAGAWLDQVVVVEDGSCSLGFLGYRGYRDMTLNKNSCDMATKSLSRKDPCSGAAQKCNYFLVFHSCIFI